MDGRESRYIREVLDWYRDEDAGDLMKSELDEPVENMTSLSAHEGKNGKRNENIVMNLKLVKNIVMNEDFVKSSVMTAKIDPNVVMELSIFRNGGWNNLQRQPTLTGRIHG